jgi:hypothetical protein
LGYGFWNGDGDGDIVMVMMMREPKMMHLEIMGFGIPHRQHHHIIMTITISPSLTINGK